MKADQQTAARATSTSLLGLALQIAMGLGLLIYAFLAKDRPAISGAAFILAGSMVWLVLAILFDQHRRERIEALEAEAIAASAAGRSSVFGETAQDLRVAARRLAWMHRVLVPILSILFAVVLGGLGAWLFTAHRKFVDRPILINQDVTQGAPGTVQPLVNTHYGWAIALGIGLAVIGFVFARYIAGLAKQSAWANLRGGAAMSVAAALVGGALAIGHFVHYAAGFDGILRFLHVVFPVAMMVIAVEVVLNFLLGMYRPRTAGETPRPAMDSRLLSFVAAPDRVAESIGGALNYQFGFNVTDSWFYQLISRWMVGLVAVGVIVVWLMTSLAVVQPNEQGILLRFGRQIGGTLHPGIYVKAPWPIDTLETIDATTIRPVQLASEPPKKDIKSILWTNDHGVQEVQFLVQPSDEERRAEGDTTEEDEETAVRDIAMVSAEIPMYYVVTDYSNFRNLVTPDQRDELLRAVGKRVTVEYLATRDVDDVLGQGRKSINDELSALINKRLDEMAATILKQDEGEADAGVEVRFVGLVGVHPPRETATMFESVVQSVQTRASNIQQAQSQAESTLIEVAGSVSRARQIADLISRIETLTNEDPEKNREEIADLERQAEEMIVRGSGAAADMLTKARGERWTKHMTARARAERFPARLAAFRAAPEVYKAQEYYRTLGEMMSKSRVYIIDDSKGDLHIDLNLEDSLIGNELFDAPRQRETNQ